jgi:hypothetical protein
VASNFYLSFIQLDNEEQSMKQQRFTITALAVVLIGAVFSVVTPPAMAATTSVVSVADPDPVLDMKGWIQPTCALRNPNRPENDRRAVLFTVHNTGTVRDYFDPIVNGKGRGKAGRYVDPGGWAYAIRFARTGDRLALNGSADVQLAPSRVMPPPCQQFFSKVFFDPNSGKPYTAIANLDQRLRTFPVQFRYQGKSHEVARWALRRSDADVFTYSAELTSSYDVPVITMVEINGKRRLLTAALSPVRR